VWINQLLYLSVFIIPFALLFGGILALGRSVLWSGTLAMLASAVLLFQIWQVTPNTMIAALTKAGLVSFDIVFILLGALLLLGTLRKVGAISTLKELLISVSPDRRIQGVLIGLFFVGFIEGLAGFGTPAMLAAPLLVVIGFPVRAAILLSLVGDTISVPFGAVGTPFVIGMSQGVSSFAETAAVLTGPEVFSTSAIIPFVIFLGMPLALAAPFFMSTLLTGFFGGNWKGSFSIWKQLVLAGFCFVIPFAAIALILGPEFPALLGSLIGTGLFIAGLKHPFFAIKKPWDFAHTNTKKVSSKYHSNNLSAIKVFKALIPYSVVVALLIGSRIPNTAFHAFSFDTLTFTVEKVAGESVNHTSRMLFSPGTFLFIGTLVSLLLFKVRPSEAINLLKETAQKSLKPAITLFVLISLAQLLLFSGNNARELPSVPVFAAEIISTLPISWYLLAPFVGLFGALVTGSVTVSNILFGSFQAQTATLGGYSVQGILALQILGAAAGNMIALHNVIAVLAAVQSKDTKTKDKDVLLLLVKPALLYALTVGVLAFCWFQIVPLFY
jgi:lactate permease